jgi:predicted naringenin-chalcone synthase
LGEATEKTIKTSKKWAVHTGSQKILDALAEHHKVDPEKLKESHEVLKEHGNLSGASLPFILEKIVREGSLSKGDIVLMVGYGWGFSAAASLLES